LLRATPFSCIALVKRDTIRLIAFPTQAVDWIHQAVQRSWPNGVSSCKLYDNHADLKLGGYPWSPSGHATVHSRQLMLSILLILKTHGYQLQSSMDISDSESTKDTLIFRAGVAEEQPHMFALSLNEEDLLRVINAPQDIQLFTEQFITQYWSRGLQKRNDQYVGGCIEFKLRGYPWGSDRQDSVNARFFIMAFLAELEQRGWYLLGAINQVVGADVWISKDSLYFHHIPTAIPFGKTMDPARWWCGSQETWLWRIDHSLSLLPLRFGSCFETTLLLFSVWKFGLLGLGSYVGIVHYQGPDRPRFAYIASGISVLNAGFGAYYLASHSPLSPSHVYAGSMGILEGLHTAIAIVLHPSAMYKFRHLFVLDALVRALAVRQELLGHPSVFRTVLIFDSYFLFIKAGISWYQYYLRLKKKTKVDQVEVKASYLQKFFFTWIWPLLKQRSNSSSPLEVKDLPRIHPDDEATPLYVSFHHHCLKYPSLSLVRHLHAVCWRPFYLAAGYLLISTIGNIAMPWILQQLLETLALDNVTQSEQLSAGLLYSLALFVAVVVKSLFEHQFWATGVRCGLHVRSILQTHLLEKALKLSPTSRQSYSPGVISSLLAMDACRIGDSSFVCTLHWDTWSGCLSLSAAIYSLYKLLGPACHVWLGFMVLYTPVSYYCGHHIKLASQEHQKNRDARSHHTSQFLHAPLTLKGCGYEDTVYNATTHSRQDELNALRRKLLVAASNVSILTAFQVIAPLCTFLTYVHILHQPLNAAVVFSALAWFSTASNPLLRVPQVISKLMDTQVSIDRLERFFTAEERYPINTSSSDNVDTAIAVHNITCQWSHNSPRLFHQLSIVIPRGYFVVCEGDNCTGKSSFLELCLQMPMITNGSVHVDGTIAYCPQTPWILNDTVRINILFGLPMDSVWYKKTLTFCALDEDILAWPEGDATFAGNQGSALSGGQKQRVSLARAIYSRRSILLLDDILASLDIHVARHILEFGLCSPELAHLTKILVLPPSRRIPSSYAGPIMRLTFEKDPSHGRIHVQNQPYDTTINSTEAEAQWEDNEQDLSNSVIQSNATELTSAVVESEESTPLGLYNAFVKGYLGLINSRSQLYCYALILFLEHFLLLGTTFALSQWSEGTASEWFYIVICMIECCFVATQRVSFVFLTLQASKGLHNLVLRAMVYAPMSFFDKNTPGMVLNRCIKDIGAVDESIPGVVSLFLFNFMEIVMSFVSIALATPWVLLAIVVLFYPYSLLYNIFRLSGRDLTRLERATRTPVLSYFSQALSGTSSLVAYHAMGSTQQCFTEYIDASIQCFWLFTIANQWVTVWLELVGVAILILVAITATYLRVYHGLTNALVGLLLTYAVRLPIRMNWTFKMLATIEMESISLERLEDLIHRTDTTLTIPNYDAMPVDGALHLHKLSFSYSPSSSLVLNNVSLLIPSNSKVAILGRTGAGKSSLVRVLLGLYSYEGSITIGGVQLNQLAEPQQHIGFIPQDPVLLGETLRDALSWPGTTDDQIYTVLNQVGMRNKVNSLDENLQKYSWSGGEAQLLMLARALLRPATKLLLCDEATAHMDSQLNAHVHEILLKLSRLTVLMICHRREHLHEFDLLAVLEKGALVQCGTPQRVLATLRTNSMRCGTDSMAIVLLVVLGLVANIALAFRPLRRSQCTWCGKVFQRKALCIILSLLLLGICILADFLLSRRCWNEWRLLYGLMDNATHATVALLAWTLTCLYTWKSSVVKSYEGIAALLTASLLDLDHFVAAAGLSFQAATSLNERPFGHAVVFIFLLALMAWLICKKELRVRAVAFILVCLLSHHLRDSFRRGLWIAPFIGSTPPLPYALYLLLEIALPWILGSWWRWIESENTIYQPVLVV
ncbi:hypothetical protein THRCLA_02145, partial [Thraustotheca clavata]